MHQGLPQILEESASLFTILPTSLLWETKPHTGLTTYLQARIYHSHNPLQDIPAVLPGSMIQTGSHHLSGPTYWSDGS